MTTPVPGAGLTDDRGQAPARWLAASQHARADARPLRYRPALIRLRFGFEVYYSTNTQRQNLRTVPDPSLFSVVAGSAEPIYRQLVAQVRRCVAGGQLKAGDELPSVRELAQSLAVNPMTVSKAFGLLEAEGLVTRRRGLAMVIAEQHQRAQPASDRIDLLRPTLQRAAEEVRQLQLPASQALALFKTLLNEQGE